MNILSNETRVIKEYNSAQKMFIFEETDEILLIENPETFNLIKL
jgi:hypothetical protein